MDHRAETLRAQGALAVLRCAHRFPGITRAEAAGRLGLSSGSAADIMGRLREAGLLAETAAPQTRGRGRPTSALVAHPEGPLVAVVDISHATWTVTTAAIGGALAPAPVHRHLGLPAEAVLPAVRDALRDLHGPRLRAVGVAIPGTVHGHTVVEATNLRWRGVDLRDLTDLPLAVGNDASLAGVAEALRGAARDASVALHLTVEVGVGGVVIVDGRPVLGAAGAGGEFGHLPFGDRERQCPCGAWGCWDLEVDGRAMARHAGREAPEDPRAYAERTLAAARGGDPAAARVCRVTAAALGRGIGALLNAVDPAVVTLGGLGADLLDVAGPALRDGVRRGAMAWRRDELPPVLPAALGSTGPAIGAAESAMALVLTEQLLTPPATRRR
ncbi:ROK family transcriptional regulator [Dactylosporangium aurantiacum]|uniref:ROK family transcriptional regulator n=1 Tax=Dactylosporangium aurantiacum TaxID=35754 RepID=A0A9Q9I9D9_9ACTN|nr:ROK family transcriptional regulator [Dactylosporangium aurantiacum]MDG6105072.1 ROK family transcriptional regulator [Dactylosporangium aurantiacum]UWZ51601.1 ROK family transcriptional regulator [Dactylosporangium aurantiacum]